MPRRTQEHQLPSDSALIKGLPSALQFEQFVLGSIMLNDTVYESIAGLLSLSDFETQRHQRIWTCFEEMHGRGERIDHALVGHELQRKGLLEHVTLEYLISLDTGIPEINNFERYAEKIKRASALRQIVFMARDTANRAISDAEDPTDILADLGKVSEKIQTGAQRESEGKNPEQIILESPGGLQGFLDPSTRKRGLPIPIKRLDFMMNGLQDGEMFIIGARPGQGKTCFALNMVEELTVDPRRHLPGAIFSLEMKGSSLLTRLICARGRVDKGRYRAGFLNREERSRVQVALSDITDAPLWIYERASMTAEDIDREVRRLHREQGLRYFMVDHLQLCATKERFENQNLKVGSITRRFHILSKDCNIPSVVLSQLGRASEKRPGAQSEPQLGDLLDSGRVEADADSVMFIFRPEVYKKTEELKGVAKLILAKQREGECSTIECRFLGNIGRFENAAGDAEEGPEFSEPPPPSFHEKEEESRW